MSTLLAIETPCSLDASRALFRQFDKSGIRYCHFKSNEHLVAGLIGDTDLDILVDRHQAQETELALLQTGFRRFPAWLKYPSIDDYIGFDSESGRLLHVQIHYSLVVGEKDLKGLSLDPQNTFLRTRVLDPETGVYVSEPNHELFLLMVRAAVKIRWRDLVFALLGKTRVGGQVAKEFRWLAERTEVATVQAIAARELGPEAAELVPDMAAAPPTIWQLRAFKSRARAALSWNRIYGPIEGRLIRPVRTLFRLAGGLNAHHLNLPLSFRRGHRAGGRVVVLLGMDGAGKSTVSKLIRSWLSWKVDVYPVYFGSGAGSASLLRWPMKFAMDTLRAVRGGRRRSDSDAEPLDGDGLHRDRRVTWPIGLWSLSLALEKQSKLKRVHRARSRGMIVICDRYPQVTVMGHNDGPLLGSWHESKSALRRRLARWEHGIYERATVLSPDLVIKLDLPAETAASRKDDMSLVALERRRRIVRELHFGDHCEHVEIDASVPLDDVLLAVKRTIWEHL